MSEDFLLRSIVNKKNQKMKSSCFSHYLASAYPSMANWGSFASMGPTTVNSDVPCTQVASAQAGCAASGFSNLFPGVRASQLDPRVALKQRTEKP
jgi:hypothetical protein